MGWTGYFKARTLSSDWHGYHRLAALMEQRELTVRQAEVILWYCRGLGPTQIGRLVGTERSNVHKTLCVAVKRLVGSAKPELVAIRRTWNQALFHCFKNRRGGCYNPPVVFDRAGNLVSLRPKILIPEDFEVWEETKEHQFLDAEAYIPAGTPERRHSDFDLFAELLAALFAQTDPKTVLESLLPDELVEDPLVFAMSA